MTANKIEGAVESIDSFGNLITNIPADALANVPRGEEVAIVCDEHETRGIFKTYGDQPEMTLIALVGSSGTAGAGDRGRQRRHHAGRRGRHAGHGHLVAIHGARALPPMLKPMRHR